MLSCSRPSPSLARPAPRQAPRLAGIRSLVLDEADQLLEMGFRPAIEKILGGSLGWPGSCVVMGCAGAARNLACSVQ